MSTDATRDPPPARKPVVFIRGAIKTPPFSTAGRLEAGRLLGRLQAGESIGMPHARPMPSIAPGCLELRVRDEGNNWRLMLYVDALAVVLLDVFPKKTQATPKTVIDGCRTRLAHYLEARGDE